MIVCQYVRVLIQNVIVVTLMYVYLHSITISTKDFPGARNDSTHVCYSGLQSSVKTLVTRMCENENKAQVFDTAANICRLFDSPPRPPLHPLRPSPTRGNMCEQEPRRGR